MWLTRRNLRSATMSCSRVDPALFKTSSLVTWSRYRKLCSLRRHRWWNALSFCATFAAIFYAALATRVYGTACGHGRYNRRDNKGNTISEIYALMCTS